MAGSYQLVIAAAPGNGLLSRRDSTLLFIPDPDERADDLLAAFAAAPSGAEWDRLAETVIDRAFDVCAFACISAVERIELRVFGDVEVRTDLRSVPMLTGAGSQTWVEHRVPGAAVTAVIATNGESVDERTDLRSGTVLAGGFRMVLGSTGALPTEVIEVIETVPQPVYVEPDDTDDDAGPLLSYVMDTLGARAQLPDELTELVAAIEPVEEPESDEPSDIADDAHAEPAAEPVSEPVASVMVLARVCKAGHANRAARVSCEVCDAFLPAGDDGITRVARPSLGTLEFDDGTTIELTGDVVIGRNPVPNGPGDTPVVLAGERLSRTHLAVRCHDWDVFVEDCGSRNGTVVVTSGDTAPVPLTPHTPVHVEDGATIYFGSCTCVFRSRRNAAIAR